MKLAAFDLCGTLYRCNTLFTFTRWLRPRSFWVRLADTVLIKSHQRNAAPPGSGAGPSISGPFGI